jgi:hypothetical protein
LIIESAPVKKAGLPEREKIERDFSARSNRDSVEKGEIFSFSARRTKREEEREGEEGKAKHVGISKKGRKN